MGDNRQRIDAVRGVPVKLDFSEKLIVQAVLPAPQFATLGPGVDVVGVTLGMSVRVRIEENHRRRALVFQESHLRGIDEIAAAYRGVQKRIVCMERMSRQFSSVIDTFSIRCLG